MTPPAIGVTTYRAPARWGVWDLPAALTPWAYVAAVADGGGIPVLLPPADGAAAAAGALLDRLDGLVVCGGPDVAPARYAAAPDPRTGPADEARDGLELALIAAARARDLPLLGICRGMQLLNVAHGGTLDQHLAGADDHAAGPGAFADHLVATAPGTRLRELLGAEAPVRSYHHQGVGQLGDGLVASATAPDGIVEGIEAPDARFALGVLWHPEMGEDRALFRALVRAARRA